MGSKYKYVQFPLRMIRNLFIKRNDTILNILTYGIYYFSRKLDYKLNAVARNLIYAYCRKRNDLSNDLVKAILSYIKAGRLNIDSLKSGFDSNAEFNPINEISELLQIFESDPSFQDNAIKFYQVKQALGTLKINHSIPEIILYYKKAAPAIPDHEPMPMIKIDLLFEFMNPSKTDFDFAQLAAYIAVHSILGKKAYYKTNKKMILSRMFGYASNKHLPDEMNPMIKEYYHKYSYRYHIDKVLQQLELSWNVITYSSYMRGLYVGNGNKTNIENLVMIAEVKKKKNQLAKLKQQKVEAREKALQQLNKEQHLNKDENEQYLKKVI